MDLWEFKTETFGLVSLQTGSLALGMPSLVLVSAVCKQCRVCVPHQMIPSCSPFNLLTRFCSQSSRSFAANFCKRISISFEATIPAPKGIFREAYVVLLFHIDLPRILSNSQLLIFAKPLYSSIMFLISDRCGGGQKE